jgi:hypothetical protein
MTVTHPVSTTLNNRLSVSLLSTAVTPAAGSAVDAGTGFGTLVIGTSALSGATGVIVSITLQKPSFSLSGGVATLLGVPLSGTATLSGTNTAAKAEIRDSSSNAIITGLTVGTSGSDINLNSVSIASSQVVTVTSATITAS